MSRLISTSWWRDSHFVFSLLHGNISVFLIYVHERLTTSLPYYWTLQDNIKRILSLFKIIEVLIKTVERIELVQRSDLFNFKIIGIVLKAYNLRGASGSRIAYGRCVSSGSPSYLVKKRPDLALDDLGLLQHLFADAGQIATLDVARNAENVRIHRSFEHSMLTYDKL